MKKNTCNEDIRDIIKELRDRSTTKTQRRDDESQVSSLEIGKIEEGLFASVLCKLPDDYHYYRSKLLVFLPSN